MGGWHTPTFTSGSSLYVACSRTRARAHTGVRGTCRAAPGRSTGGPPTRPPAARCQRSSTARRGRCSRGWGLCDAGMSPQRPWSRMWGGKAPWFVPRSPGTLKKRGGKNVDANIFRTFYFIFSKWWGRKAVVSNKEEKRKSGAQALSELAACLWGKVLFQQINSVLLPH